jgi:GNAT superfamily N-acetyltransferase
MEELTSLVRSAYKQLSDMGFRYWGTWQSEDDTRQRCSEGRCLVAEEGGRLVGTVTVKQCHDRDDPEWYLRNGTWVVTQFAVDPSLQGTGLGSKLLTAAESHAYHSGGDEAAVDTAEGADHLIEFYAKRGYRHVGEQASAACAGH